MDALGVVGAGISPSPRLVIRRDLDGAEWVCVATIRIAGRPIVKKNSRVLATGPRPVSLPSAAYRQWAKVAVWEAMAQWRAAGLFAPVGGPEQPVWLKCRFVLPVGGFADLSNLYEGIQDVLQDAKVLHNDRWIAHHDGSRVHVGPDPHVTVKLMLPVAVVPVCGSVA